MAAPPAAPQPLARSLYFAVWRWHFYAGLFVIPFLLMLSVTGLIILWFTAIAPEYGDRLHVTPQAEALRLTDLGAAVHRLYPEGVIQKYVAPYDNSTPALFAVGTGNGDRMLAMDPYTGSLLQDRAREGTWNDFATSIHGKLLWGANNGPGDTLIEIAAGFGIILLVTGLYLWWPRNGTSLGRALSLNLAETGRAFWKSLHQFTGIWLSVVLLFFLLSGLAWTPVWGGKLVQAWSTFPAQKWDNVPLSDKTHASLNSGNLKEVPWALEQTLMPKSGSQAGIAGLPEGMRVNLESVVALGRAIGFAGRFQVAYPADATGVWTLSQDSMSYDSSSPTADRTVHVDQYSGKILASAAFADYSLPGKAMAVSIALHEGQLGWWNIALNTLYCTSVIALCLSGVAMWWLRRPKLAFRLAPPPLPSSAPLMNGLVLLIVGLSLFLPLTGLTLVAILTLDVLVISRISALKNLVR
nr:PepSY domain-containing protein [uncultured Gellertiella sp.]